MGTTYEPNSMNSHNLSSAFSEGSISQKVSLILKHQYSIFTWEDKSSIWWQVDSIRFLHSGNGNKSFPQELTLSLVTVPPTPPSFVHTEHHKSHHLESYKMPDTETSGFTQYSF